MYEISIENKYGDRLNLTGNPNYIVKVSGLSPVQSNIITAAVANYGGERYVSSRQQKRNIVFTIYINYPVETNRIRLYQYIKSDDYIRVYYKNRTRNVYIDGYVESFELNHFTQPQSAQVSIICPQPNFIDINGNSVTNGIITRGFYTPFNTEVIESDNSTEAEYDYSGAVRFVDFLATPISTQSGTPSPTNAVAWSGVGNFNVDYYYTKLCLGVGRRNYLLSSDTTASSYTLSDTLAAGNYMLSALVTPDDGATSVDVYSGSTLLVSIPVIGALSQNVVGQIELESELSGDLTIDNATVTRIKLEAGTEVTRWTPAPEDNVSVEGVFKGVSISLGEQIYGVNLIAGGASLVASSNHFITAVLLDELNEILTDENGVALYD